MSPVRFHAARGQRLRPGQKLVGRNTRWGNPFPVAAMVRLDTLPRLVRHYAEKWKVDPASLVCDTPEEAVGRYRTALLEGNLDYTAADVREHLAGFDLGCPCGLECCHADVLLEVAGTRG